MLIAGIPGRQVGRRHRKQAIRITLNITGHYQDMSPGYMKKRANLINVNKMDKNLSIFYLKIFLPNSQNCDNYLTNRLKKDEFF
jgi:hypothetical protein